MIKVTDLFNDIIKEHEAKLKKEAEDSAFDVFIQTGEVTKIESSNEKMIIFDSLSCISGQNSKKSSGAGKSFYYEYLLTNSKRRKRS